MSDQLDNNTIRARSDVSDFPTVGEAIDEALLRADGASVFLHRAGFDGEHYLTGDGICPCQPLQIDSALK